jgi:hypothetical protein
VPTPNNEQLKELTQLRLLQARQVNARRAIFRRAGGIIQRAEYLIAQYVNLGDDAALRALFQLEDTMASLVTEMAALRAEEVRTRALEAEIWRQVD